MITIIGGELLCALGSGAQRIDALRRGKPELGTINVNVGGGKVAYPYYRIDETPRKSYTSIVDSYLDRVVNDLLGNLKLKPASLTNVGLFLGSSSIDYSLAWPVEEDVDDAFATRCKRERVGGGNYLESLMQRFGFTGPSLTFNTACTSSANALMEAASMLVGNIIDYALVLGLELYSPTTLEGFAMMQLLSPEAIRPFDQSRNGIVLGEAVSAVLLSREEIMASPWRYLGGKSSCETYSVTSADPNGAGVAQVMREALEDAGTAPEAIIAVKAHGTASRLNDQAEMRGMEQVFTTLPPYLSLKPYIGHTLGGCGVVELLLMMESVDAGFIPASLNLETLDCEFSQAPIGNVMPVTSGHFMLNYFGFGGNNTSFIIEKTAP
ncbi:MAG: beta-ketoacyl synthase N-terminal-like domain-containing protein [Pseudomonadota bacterium]|nr:beta-ketoacyl synthase N-terminal-like domain-containing protein [Pseudomonadota bacterium]